MKKILLTAAFQIAIICIIGNPSEADNMSIRITANHARAISQVLIALKKTKHPYEFDFLTVENLDSDIDVKVFFQDHGIPCKGGINYRLSSDGKRILDEKLSR